MTISDGENPTSYFSTPSTTLDPKLFQGRSLQSWVRSGILSMLHDYLGRKYRHPETWSHPWLAGSGVSYQWSADRQPGDLDCLVGVDFIQFRKANPEYAGLLDKEIADLLNEGFHDELQQETENWNGYELTFYVNVTGTDIRNIRPYAAYDLRYDEWTVTPDPMQTAPQQPEWDSIALNDANLAHQVHVRFTQAKNDLMVAHDAPSRRNAEVRLQTAMQQGDALYTDIHEGRKQAFSPTGEGYADFNNYRWQAGKKLGTVDKLRSIKKYVDQNQLKSNLRTYGIDLPTADTLIRRAAIYRNK